MMIEYLESRNFDGEEIAELQNFFVRKTVIDDIEKKMEEIYKVFRYAGLTETETNEIILKNKTLLIKNAHDLINIAYVWMETGVLKDESTLHRGRLELTNYLKVYLRNLYLNSGINYLKSPVTYHALTVYEKRFSEDYMGYLGKITINPYYEVLVQLYGKGNTLKEKEKYLKLKVSNEALKWFFSCLKKERGNQNGRSIQIRKRTME